MRFLDAANPDRAGRGCWDSGEYQIGARGAASNPKFQKTQGVALTVLRPEWQGREAWRGSLQFLAQTRNIVNTQSGVHILHS